MIFPWFCIYEGYIYLRHSQEREATKHHLSLRLYKHDHIVNFGRKLGVYDQFEQVCII